MFYRMCKKFASARFSIVNGGLNGFAGIFTYDVLVQEQNARQKHPRLMAHVAVFSASLASLL